MWHQIFRRNILILVFTATIGLALAFTLPWFANEQGLASEGIPTEPPHTANLGSSPGHADLLEHESSTLPGGPLPPLCFATHNNGATVFESFNGDVVQRAVDKALPGATVKVAGTCMWVEQRLDFTQTVYISQPLTLQGGYQNGKWNLEPDPEYYTTTLYAGNNGRVIVISGTQDVTLDSLFIVGGLAGDGTLSNNGGGIWSNSPMTLTNSIIYSNTAKINGGGIYNLGISPEISNVTFLEDYAFSGGGIYNDGSLGGDSSPNLTSVTFSGNRAKFGAGMYNFGWLGKSSPHFTNAAFTGNSADSIGGAVYNHGEVGESNPIMLNVTFSGNLAGGDGGAMFNHGYAGESSPSLTNVVFSGNSAGKKGGALSNWGHEGASSPTLVNVTFSGNSADGAGGAMYNDGFDGESIPDVYNSILWNNQGSGGARTISATIYLTHTASITLTHSLVEGSGGSGSSWIGGSYIDGGGNLDSSPLFFDPVSPSSAPTTTGNLRLNVDSPAIDMGANEFVLDVLTDLDGDPRIADGGCRGTAVVDMGAFEYQRDMCYQRVCPLVIR
jgi:hypothetical protein